MLIIVINFSNPWLVEEPAVGLERKINDRFICN